MSPMAPVSGSPSATPVVTSCQPGSAYCHIVKCCTGEDRIAIDTWSVQHESGCGINSGHHWIPVSQRPCAGVRFSRKSRSARSSRSAEMTQNPCLRSRSRQEPGFVNGTVSTESNVESSASTSMPFTDTLETICASVPSAEPFAYNRNGSASNGAPVGLVPLNREVAA